MVEVAEIAEDCTLLGETPQKIVSNRRLIVLIFEDDDEHVVEMLWPGRRDRRSGRVLRKAKDCNGAKEEN
jgi:hypothetical protein